ncbi:MAG TPA: hypothetical protein VGA67_00280 [Candidatus Dojkabacteria bacterium]
MPDDEIQKPSLTQRRKITGSNNLSSQNTNPLSILNSDEDEGGSEDISIVKVVGIILAVVIIAVIAALVIINLQGGDDDPQDSNDVETTPTPTPTVIVTPSVSPTPTLVTDEDTDEDTDTDTEGSSDASFSSGATGSSIKIRTYQYSNFAAYFELALPSESTTGGDNVPNATASYNTSSDLVVEISNINSFGSCGFMNTKSEEGAFNYNNVSGITCAKVGDKYTLTFDTAKTTSVKLLSEKRSINSGAETLDALIIQVNHN